jgi:hypothetical protein
MIALVLGSLLASCSPAPAAPAASPGPTALPPGSLTSDTFQPPVSFSVPVGWFIDADTERYFALRPAISDLVGIHVFRSPVAAAEDAACPDSPEPGVGSTARELSDWIQGRDGLNVSSPRLASVGGLTGFDLDVEIEDGWTASCPFANGLPAVPLFVSAEGDFRWVVAGTERLRLSLLDAPGGVTLVVDVDAFDGALLPDLLVSAQPIVRSMRFDVR